MDSVTLLGYTQAGELGTSLQGVGRGLLWDEAASWHGARTESCRSSK